MVVMVDFLVKVDEFFLTDASSAPSMVLRRGVGCTRSIEVQRLWIQHEVGRKVTKVPKVNDYARN